MTYALHLTGVALCCGGAGFGLLIRDRVLVGLCVLLIAASFLP